MPTIMSGSAVEGLDAMRTAAAVSQFVTFDAHQVSVVSCMVMNDPGIVISALLADATSVACEHLSFEVAWPTKVAASREAPGVCHVFAALGTFLAAALASSNLEFV